MNGIIASALAIVVGTLLGSLVKERLTKKLQDTLFMAVGLAAFGIGIEYVVNNLSLSKYPVLFILSLAIGSLLGTWWDLQNRIDRLAYKYGKSNFLQGLVTVLLLYCIGALAIVGPVVAATRGDQEMLMTNAALDFVTGLIFGASFGWGMIIGAPVLFVWQTSIFLIAKYLSAGFFSRPLITELSIVGGFLIMTTGLNLLKIKDLKTLNLLPSLLIPIIFFIGLGIFGH